jgi:chaperonin GroES
VLDNGTKIPLEIKVGDTVYYSKYSGTEIKIEEKEYIIIAESDILAIVA